MRADDLLALMRERRSVRRFAPRRPPRAAIEALVEAAITAPSASNKQPWRFFIASDPARINAMAAAEQARLDEILPLLEDGARAEVASYGRYFVRFADAPVVIAPACRPLKVLSHLVGAQPLDAAWRDDIGWMEQQSATVSTGLAIQNLMLAAQASGLGSSCLAGPLVATGALQTLLGIPPGWRLACLLAVGYPDEEPASPGRKPVDAALRWLDPDQ
jgi:nitroreductase